MEHVTVALLNNQENCKEYLTVSSPGLTKDYLPSTVVFSGEDPVDAIRRLVLNCVGLDIPVNSITFKTDFKYGDTLVTFFTIDGYHGLPCPLGEGNDFKIYWRKDPEQLKMQVTELINEINCTHH